MKHSRLHRTTVNVRMFCPPVYYQRYTSFATDNIQCVRGKTRFFWCDSVQSVFFSCSCYLVDAHDYSMFANVLYVYASGSRASEKEKWSSQKSCSCVLAVCGKHMKNVCYCIYSTYDADDSIQFSQNVRMRASRMGSPRVYLN